MLPRMSAYDALGTQGWGGGGEGTLKDHHDRLF